jgi:hypothetical protein
VQRAEDHIINCMPSIKLSDACGASQHAFNVQSLVTGSTPSIVEAEADLDLLRFLLLGDAGDGLRHWVDKHGLLYLDRHFEFQERMAKPLGKWMARLDSSAQQDAELLTGLTDRLSKMDAKVEMPEHGRRQIEAT